MISTCGKISIGHWPIFLSNSLSQNEMHLSPTVFLLVFRLVLANRMINLHDEHTCFHSVDADNIIIGRGHAESGKVKRAASAGLRLTPIYTSSFNNHPRADLFKRLIVTPSIEYWSAALKPVNPTTKNLLLSRACATTDYSYQNENGRIRRYCRNGCAATTACFTATIPTTYLDKCYEIVNGQPQTTGVEGTGMPDSDFLLFVDATEEGICTTSSNTLGYAAPCQLEDDLDRPIGGYINFCTNRLSTSYPDLEISLTVALHEIGHALGFTDELYAFFRDSAGQPLTNRDPTTNLPPRDSTGIKYLPSENVIKSETRDWKSARGTFKRTFRGFVMPAILKAAREHFNCSTLTQVDLEDQGSSGTTGSHFKKRVVNDELMAGSVSKRTFASRITLGFFEGTGWYIPDYSKAENYQWGKNMGCDFILKSCYERMELQKSSSQNLEPWCATPLTTPAQFRCLQNDNAFGYCELTRLSGPLSDMFVYFDQLPGVSQTLIQYYGHQSALLDHCPVYNSFYTTTSPAGSTYCDDAQNNRAGGDFLMQTYGNQSICINHETSIPWQYYQCGAVNSYEKVLASCHKFVCSPTSGLSLVFGNKQYLCPLEGGRISVDTADSKFFLAGQTICPRCNSVCQNCPLKQDFQVVQPDAPPEVLFCSAPLLPSLNNGWTLSICFAFIRLIVH